MTVSPVSTSSSQLAQTLKNIVDPIQILADYSIVHPQYGVIELPLEIKERFGQMSESVQDNYLQARLQTIIYGYCNSHAASVRELERIKIENQATKWSKSQFYAQLRANNHCQARFETDWQAVGITEEGELQVRKNGLTVHIRAEHHLPQEQQQATIGETVSVKMPSQLVEPGHYIAVGSAGSPEDLEGDRAIINIYFHINAEGALTLMDCLTRQLDKIAIPFRFKVSYYRNSYYWRNAGVLSCDRADYLQIKPLLLKIHQEAQSCFKPEIPLFTKYLAPGFSLAEQPLSETLSSETFCQNRSKLVAQGLISAWKDSEQSSETKIAHIYNRFAKTKINLEKPYLNPNSVDIY